jgi:ABC-type phosphate transport system substrate-binding protein
MRASGRVRLSLVAVGSVVALGALAPGAANAQFTLGKCAGDSINGEGASFARSAHIAWGARILDPNPNPAQPQGFAYHDGACSAFETPGDGGTEEITYAPTGSGAGRTAMGANGNANTRTLNDEEFGGTDDAPTAAQITEANTGPDDVVGSTDDTILHTIPVAQSAIAVAVKLPAGCQVAEGATRQMTFAQLEGSFRGGADFDAWGEVLPAVTGTHDGTPCADVTFQRVVRLDSSGTTAQFKNFLQVLANVDAVNSPLCSDSCPAASGVTWTGLGNTAWPDEVANPVERGDANGAGPLIAKLTAEGADDGGVGYADLASGSAQELGADDFRWNGNDDDSAFEVAVQRPNDNNFVLPADDISEGGTKGANCAGTEYDDVPGSTTGSWVNSNPIQTSVDYPICALTYVMANEDPCPDLGTDAEALARTVKDYVTFITDDDPAVGGQAVLAADDYQELPSSNDVLLRAQQGAAALTWAASPNGVSGCQ